MAISEVCKYEVKKEIDLCVETGMSRNEASKWLAEKLSEVLEKEIKPGTIRQKDLRVRNELATNVATQKEWPTCLKCKKEPTVFILRGRGKGTPRKDGLCRFCRNEAEQAKVDEKQKKFDKIPIDTKADKYWKQMVSQFDEILQPDKLQLGKISLETFNGVLDWYNYLGRAVGYLGEETIFST